jgi:hypothetical protein
MAIDFHSQVDIVMDRSRRQTAPREEVPMAPRTTTRLSITSLLLAGGLTLAAAATARPAGAVAEAAAPGEHDGRHDFDFEVGAWRTRVSRLQRPLTGSTAWVEYEGTTLVREIWEGRALLVELDVAGPAGRIEGLSLRLYDPESRRWSLHYASRAGGPLSPPAVGAFRDGRGEFYSEETLDGRPILVRFVVSDITPDSCRFEQAFSADRGRTWEVNWVATDTRVAEPPDPAP